jgi:hypothetical protein
MSASDVDFDALPRRVFLDSSTLQTLLDFGGTIFDGEEPTRTSIPGHLEDRQRGYASGRVRRAPTGV